MAAARPFSYEPLHPDDNKAFRLLQILPGKHGDAIKCTIGNVSLGNLSGSDTGARNSVLAPLIVRRAKKKTFSTLQRRLRKQWDSLTKVRQAPEAPTAIEEQLANIPDKLNHYECLSYAWGFDEAKIKVLLNEMPFDISLTLESALRHLRKEKCPRAIWIDAICIDQNNDVEKARQIQFMQEIYANADLVVVWLGNSTSDSDLAISFSQEIANLVSQQGGVVIDIHAVRPILEKHQLLGDARLPDWRALHTLMGRTWWRRAWVVQEIICAKAITFMCGSIAVPWPVLGQAAVAVRSTYYHFENFFEENSHLERFLISPENCQGAFDLIFDHATYEKRIDKQHSSLMWLNSSRKRFCRLPHDKIFSVLGLTSDSFRNAIPIDYTQTIEDLFKAVVKAHINETNTLDIISYSQYFVWHPNIPSWMPDWRLRDQSTTNGWFRIHSQNRHSWPANVTFSPNLSELVVRGTEVASITEAGLERRLIPRFERLLIPGVDQNGETNLDRRSHWLVEWHCWEDIALFAKRHWDLKYLARGRPDIIINILLKRFETLWNSEALDMSLYEKSSLPQNTSTVLQQTKSNLDDLIEDIRESTRNATIVATKDFLGLAPDVTECGDVIYIISGCYTPMVLRPCGQGKFRVIGDIFLGGVDKGENRMFPVFSRATFPDLEDITLV